MSTRFSSVMALARAPLFALLAVPIAAQSPERLLGNNVSIAQTTYKEDGIHSTDFRTFTYEDCKAWGGRAISLRNGEYSYRDGFGETRSKLIAIRYVDLNADGRDEAVIDIRTWSYGSTPYTDDYYVFQYRQGVLELIFHTSRETPKRMIVRRRTMTIVAPYWSDGSGPFCCPPYIETIIYRWQGSKLIVAGRKMRRKNYPGMKVGRG